MSTTLDYNLLGEVERLTAGNTIARPRRKRDRWGRWHRDDAGEFDWYYALTETERSYVSSRYFSNHGVEVDVLATMAGIDSVDEWAERFLACVRGARGRTVLNADIFSDEWRDAAEVSSYDDDVELSQLVGPVELAELLDVKVNTIAQWRKRFEDFPAPVLVLSGTFIWKRGEVERWASRHGRVEAS